MNTHRINHLLLQIFLKGDVISFDELYNYKKSYMDLCVRNMYGQVEDRSLNTVEDITNQAWLNAWLYMNKDRVRVYAEVDINDFLSLIAKDTIIEANKK